MGGAQPCTHTSTVIFTIHYHGFSTSLRAQLLIIVMMKFLFCPRAVCHQNALSPWARHISAVMHAQYVQPASPSFPPRAVHGFAQLWVVPRSSFSPFFGLFLAPYTVPCNRLKIDEMQMLHCKLRWVTLISTRRHFPPDSTQQTICSPTRLTHILPHMRSPNKNLTKILHHFHVSSPAQHGTTYCQPPSPASSHWNRAFSCSWWWFVFVCRVVCVLIAGFTFCCRCEQSCRFLAGMWCCCGLRLKCTVKRVY